MTYVIPFEKLGIRDIGLVGGKNASLGELINELTHAGVRVPGGFATTAQAFRDFLSFSGLDTRIAARLDTLDTEIVEDLVKTGAEIRQWILETPLPEEFVRQVKQAFMEFDRGCEGAFAVRSSATSEDLPDASFAGQQETYLNVVGFDDVLDKIVRVFASLYNDRAISYRVHKGYAHKDVAISVGIQRMVRSDAGSSGVAFTLDTESGFREVVFITSSYGLGETVVQGQVNPDEFYVFKPALAAGHLPIVSRRIGSKLVKMELDPARTDGIGTRLVDVSRVERNRFSLTDEEIVQLSRYAVAIEQHYGRPMDIEWGKDGFDGQIYILQARPETVKSGQAAGKGQQRYRLKSHGQLLVTGRAIGQKVGSGTVKIVADASDMDKVQAGDVLVTDMTDPNWEPVMKRASAIVTNRGGRTCHAAIIARELGIPAVVGCETATDDLREIRSVTVSCAEGDEGHVYEGLLDIEVQQVHQGIMPAIDIKIMMNVGNPQLAYEFAQLPNEGVGLARLEFIINNNIGIHPKAVLDYPLLEADLKARIESAARGYASPRAFFVEKLSEGIATIAAAFWPKPVVVRLSDFKTNEYRKLAGGVLYEPEEENPMLGFRGASRYLAEGFANCLNMELEALRRVRDLMGLANVQIMVPFVRTLGQAQKVVGLLEEGGLVRGENGLKLIMMCELPSNAILAERFLEYFDGFSLGSNDMTQLTLGLDRDSGMELLTSDFDERDDAVRFLLARAIRACLAANKYVGICGQGPSDRPDFAAWLQEEGILSMSLNPDTVVRTWLRLAGASEAVSG